MSNGTVIICSSAGEHLDFEKVITVFDGTVLSLGIKLDVTALAAYPSVGDFKAAQFRRMVERDYEKWHAKLTDLGVPNVEHEPHSS